MQAAIIRRAPVSRAARAVAMPAMAVRRWTSPSWTAGSGRCSTTLAASTRSLVLTKPPDVARPWSSSTSFGNAEGSCRSAAEHVVFPSYPARARRRSRLLARRPPSTTQAPGHGGDGLEISVMAGAELAVEQIAGGGDLGAGDVGTDRGIPQDAGVDTTSVSAPSARSRSRASPPSSPLVSRVPTRTTRQLPAPRLRHQRSRLTPGCSRGAAARQGRPVVQMPVVHAARLECHDGGGR